MKKYLDQGIKDIISRFPGVGSILEEYGIDCTTCMVGTCELKSVITVHQLPPEEELAMMARIEHEIYPERELAIPPKDPSVKLKSKKQIYSAPVNRLVVEHKLIKRWLALIPEVIKRLDLESEQGINLIRDGVDMIRSYADKYHHAKEEDIFFKYFDENDEIFQVMHQDHKNARGHAKAILEGVEQKDAAKVSLHLEAYRKLLTEHIKKEDDILFPWMDRKLSQEQFEELFFKFGQMDENIGFSPEKYKAFIDRLEKEFQ